MYVYIYPSRSLPPSPPSNPLPLARYYTLSLSLRFSITLRLFSSLFHRCLLVQLSLSLSFIRYSYYSLPSGSL